MRGAGGSASVLEWLRASAAQLRACGIETPRLDAECLLASVLGVERSELYRDLYRPVSPQGGASFRELVRRRALERVPVAQLLGRKEFWSLSLAVSLAVLTPRPETETLVEAALALLPEVSAPAAVLEVGTGSGAVALAIARERPAARIVATDVCPEALALAGANARALALEDRLTLLLGRGFEPVSGRRFDVVVSNPPYLADSERGFRPELVHEPETALFAGPEGLDVLRELVEGVGAVLVPGGGVALEVAPAQAAVVAAGCRRAGLEDVACLPDLAGRPRVVRARKPEEPWTRS